VRPVIVGIGGGYSGAGKTSVVSLILRSFKGWGAIKYTKTSLYSSIVDDLAVISEEGKDTRKFIDAGAEKVLWVKSPYSELSEVLPVAIGMLSHLEGIVMEGNSAIEIVKPDIVIFACGTGEGMKDGAKKILRMADIVISQSNRPLKMPQRAMLFAGNKEKELMQYLAALIANFRNNID